MSEHIAGREPFDALVVAWLDDRAHGPSPEAVFDRVVAATARTAPLPAWRLPERWLPRPLWRAAAPGSRTLGLVVLVGLLIIAVVALAIGAGSRRLPPPFGLAAPGKVVYVADNQIWTAAVDGDGRRQITFGDRIDGTPVYSRDGTKIAFKRFPTADSVANWEEWGDVMVAEADGSNPVVIDRMVHAPSPPSWFPDGRFITYSKIVGDADQIIVAAVDGSSVRVVTGGPDANWAPAIHPNGHTISFVKGYPKIIGMDAIEIDGTNERPLTTFDFKTLDGEEWSPDGATLLIGAGDGTSGTDDIWAISLDGRSERKIISLVRNDTSPAWSPDGSMFAWLSNAPAATQVWIARADGSDAHPISDTGSWFGPQWSPDARHVLAVDGRQSGEQPIVVILDPSGRDPAASFALPDTSGLGRADQASWQRLAP